MNSSGFIEHTVPRGGYTLRVVEGGNPTGKPLIFFHGGPGAGLDQDKIRLFGTDNYRVIFFDQRSVGGSRPRVVDAQDPEKLEGNTTAGTVEDAVAIRDALGIEETWVLAGGSFGSTLSLIYAMKHPDHVAGLFLYGIFLCRDEDVRFFDPDGFAALARSDAYARFLDWLPGEERGDPVAAYEKRFWSADADEREAAARRWALWNQGLFHTRVSVAEASSRAELDQALCMARLFTYYKRNGMFLSETLGSSEGNNQILENLRLLPKVPFEILNGEADLVTPLAETQVLHSALQEEGMEAGLTVVPNAGHSTSEDGYVPALLSASNRLFNRLKAVKTEGASTRHD